MRFLKYLTLLTIIVLAGFKADAGTVLLSFDVEKTGDGNKLEQMNIDVPATYFILGKFAEENSDVVKSLSDKGNTIGSHAYSHDNLKEMSQGAMRLELKATKKLLEEITGKPLVWFRAPFLEFNESIAETLVELGYKYDSSEHEQWRQQRIITEIPVSSSDEDGKTASDYDIFIQEKMSDDDALNWLKQRYIERESTGRPLMFLMHPSIIYEHKGVLEKFIQYVKEQGGEFLSGDEWLKKDRTQSFKRLGFWVDFSVSTVDTEKLIKEAKSVHATDIFLMATDQEGHEYFARKEGDDDRFGKILTELKKAGFKVHAWLPMLLNPKIAQINKEWAMVDNSGMQSIYWLSPFNPEVKFYLTDTIRHLLTKYELDGLNLDYIRFPDIAHDFSPNALKSFKERYNNKIIQRDKILSEHYTDWTKHREKAITELVKTVRETVNEFGNDDFKISADLIADSSLHYRSTEKFSQNYSELAKYLDIIIPMSYFKNDRQDINWIEKVYHSTRYHAGNKEVLTGLASYQQPKEWKMTDREFAESVKLAANISEGIVFYNYANLFGHGETADWNMNSANVDFLKDYMKDVLKGGTNPVKLDRKTKLALAASTCLFLIFAALLIAIRRKDIHGNDFSDEEPKGYFVEIKDMDFKKMESYISSSDKIDPVLVKKVSGILKKIGVHNISHFRKMLLLQIISETSITLNDLQKKIITLPNITSGLRRIEELALLGFIHIDSQGNITITELGKEVLKKSGNNGYRRELIQFIDNRLVEQLIIICGKCEEPVHGLWFWEDFECYSCKAKHKMDDSKSIRIQRVQ